MFGVAIEKLKLARIIDGVREDWRVCFRGAGSFLLDSGWGGTLHQKSQWGIFLG